MLQYSLKSTALGAKKYINIEEKASRDISLANNILIDSTYIEDVYDIVLLNFAKMKEEISSIVINDMIFSVRGDNEIKNSQSVMNMYVSNILSSFRALNDHTDRILKNKKIYGDSITSVSDAKKHEYDSCKEYRIIENIRNYAQHKKMPITQYSIGGNWEGANLEARRHYLSIYASPNELLQDCRFKRKMELDVSGDEKIDLLYCISTYIDCIGSIQSAIRRSIEKHVSYADNIMNHYISLWQNEYPDDSRLLLHMISYCEDPMIFKKICPINDKAAMRREYLRRKNPGPKNLAYAYAATRGR